jgi:hypothetical protein
MSRLPEPRVRARLRQVMCARTADSCSSDRSRIANHPNDDSNLGLARLRWVDAARPFRNSRSLSLVQNSYGTVENR